VLCAGFVNREKVHVDMLQKGQSYRIDIPPETEITQYTLADANLRKFPETGRLCPTNIAPEKIASGTLFYYMVHGINVSISVGDEQSHHEISGILFNFISEGEDEQPVVCIITNEDLALCTILPAQE